MIKLRALSHPLTNFSPDFDANARCVSNSGAPGYDIEDYLVGSFSKDQSMFGKLFQTLSPQLSASSM